MKMSAKFIHVFAVGLFVLTFMSSFSSPNREGMAISCEPVDTLQSVLASESRGTGLTT